ncbi:4-hydroxy-2-oxoheptanedioate aldolase [soil metagenome]
MDLPINHFKKAIASVGASAQIGLWLGLADPYAAEVSAGAGFDWLLIDGEHAPNDVRSLLGQLQVIAPYPVHPVLRPPTGDVALIKQYLDIGAQTLLIPMIETAAQAELMVKAMRYPPEGIRGVGAALARASRFNRVPGYLNAANAQMCLLVQVESKTGLDNIAEIAAVDGVDGVFIGPADLSAALGHLGNPMHADVVSAIGGAVDAILAAGKAPGILMADEKMARMWIERGCRFVAVGTDVTVLVRGTTALAEAFKGNAAADAGSGSSPSGPY